MNARCGASVMLLGLVCACSTDDEGGVPSLEPGAGVLGDSCQRSEDCASTFCVDLGGGQGICSTKCLDSSDCPAIDNWDCVTSSMPKLKVCACRKLSKNEICGDGQDNDCNGRADDCRVCNGHQVPNDDPLNCGACGKACRSDQSCKDGECSCPTSKPNDCGACTDTTKDVANCGACGKACGTGQSCVEGICQCPAGDASTFCVLKGCVDTKTDSDHCGACGNACTFGRICQDGSCACSAANQTFCDGVGCIDATTNANNCGSCGTACGTGKVCREGKCECPTGKEPCGDTCVDLTTDKDHCGTCDKACATAQACVDGTCGCTQFGYTVCGNDCANLQTSTAHCGSCDTTCATGEQCLNGACVCTGKLYCDGACIAFNDRNNCGACGKICGTGQICSNGNCICEGAGLSLCGDTCVDQRTDESHCGTCETTCPSAQSCLLGKCSCSSSTLTYCADVNACVTLSSNNSHCGACGKACKADEYCSSGACRCLSYGETYCENIDACTDLDTDPTNCGTCGTACRTGEICTGTCTCPAGQAYCENAGKCVAVATDVANCGTCGTTCQPTQICQNGTCRCSLSSEKYCASANACIDVFYDEQNCGDCGKVCPADTTCNYRNCACTDSTKTLCTDACFDLKTDKNHCGSCTNVCTGSLVCAAGKCTCPMPVVGNPVRLTSNTLLDAKPSAAWDGTHIGVAYVQTTSNGTTSSREIRFALLNADGTLVSDTALTQYSSGGSYYLDTRYGPHLVWNGSEYALTWIEFTATAPRVVFQRLDPTGTAKAERVSVGNTTELTYQSIYFADLAWSELYGGYAVAYGNEYALAFRRIGADASRLEAPNVVTQGFCYSSYRSPQLLAAADGTWAVTGGDSSTVRLALFNADGSRTLSPATLSTSTDAYYNSRWPSMAYDGSSWLTAWVGNSTRDVFVNRGSAAAAPSSIVTGVAPVAFGNVNLAMSGSTLAVGWSERTSITAAAQYRYLVQRFSIPTSLASAPVPLHGAVQVLPTYNIAATDDVTLVSTGANGLVAIWSDDRWGATRELYAAPIDLQSCP